jgi:hypothetical protein
LLAKKDAHPENWLIRDDGAMVMLDMEAAGVLPAFYEAVQLIEDYPLCPISNTGWTERIWLIDAYRHALSDYGVEIPSDSDQDIGGLYAGFACTRAAIGLARLLRRGPATDQSTSSLRHQRARLSHLRDLLTWAPRMVVAPDLQAGASVVAALADPLIDSTQTIPPPTDEELAGFEPEQLELVAPSHS